MNVSKKNNGEYGMPGNVISHSKSIHTVSSAELMTEEELILFLRIPQISNSKNYHNVIENLKKMHDLPRIHICGKALYPLEGIREWIREKQQKENSACALH